jgi:perosamine synthetase
MCPVAEAAYAEQLSLPLFPGMRDADQDRVIDSLVDALR